MTDDRSRHEYLEPKIMHPALVHFTLLLSSFGQSGDPQSLLNQIREQVSAIVESAPRYTCTDLSDYLRVRPQWDHRPRTCRDLHGAILGAKGTLVKSHLLRMETPIKPRQSYITTVQFDQLAGYSLHLNSVIAAKPSNSAFMPRRLELDNPPSSSDPAACLCRLNDKQANLKGALTRWVAR